MSADHIKGKGVIKDENGQTVGNYESYVVGDSINVALNYTTFDLYLDILGLSYYDTSSPSTAHISMTTECIQSNLDGCLKWRCIISYRPNIPGPWEDHTVYTFEKNV